MQEQAGPSALPVADCGISDLIYTDRSDIIVPRQSLETGGSALAQEVATSAKDSANDHSHDHKEQDDVKAGQRCCCC